MRVKLLREVGYYLPIILLHIIICNNVIGIFFKNYMQPLFHVKIKYLFDLIWPLAMGQQVQAM